MFHKLMRLGLTAMALISPLAFGVRARADLYSITVTNSQPSGGFAFSPVWFGLHNGSFSAFSAGDDLNGSPYQTVAELANTGPITAAFAGNGPQITVGGMPYVPGASASGILDVTDPTSTRFLNYASMIVPSNDFFFANDSTDQLILFNTFGQLVDSVGDVTSERTILIFGTEAWDAGTEVNNANFGAAFLVGDNITDHTAENGHAALVFGGGTDNSSYLNSINGRATPGGYNISHLISADDLIATIKIRPVPEPGSMALVAIGMVGFVGIARRKRRMQELA